MINQLIKYCWLLCIKPQSWKHSQNRYYCAAKLLHLWQNLASFLFNLVTHRTCYQLLFQIQSLTPVRKRQPRSENFWCKPTERQSKQQFQRFSQVSGAASHLTSTIWKHIPQDKCCKAVSWPFILMQMEKSTSSSCSGGKISLNKILKSMLNILIRTC